MEEYNYDRYSFILERSSKSNYKLDIADCIKNSRGNAKQKHKKCYIYVLKQYDDRRPFECSCHFKITTKYVEPKTIGEWYEIAQCHECINSKLNYGMSLPKGIHSKLKELYDIFKVMNSIFVMKDITTYTINMYIKKLIN